MSAAKRHGFSRRTNESGESPRVGAEDAPAPARSLPWRLLLSPGGAILSAVCFFLPWGRFSCFGLERRASGAEIGGGWWLVFACAAAAALSGFGGRLLRRPGIGHAGSLGAALIGLLFFAGRALEASRGVRTPLGRIHSGRAAIDPAFGLFGTVLGLMAALAGAALAVFRLREKAGRR